MSALLNGPVTLTIVGLGVVFNTLTIFVLATKKIQRYRQSVYNSPQTRKFSNTIHNDRCSTEATNNPLASTRKRPTRSSASRPRVYTFFVWLAVSDTSLLLCALLLYSLPNLVADLGPYVYFFPLFYYLSNTALTTSVSQERDTRGVTANGRLPPLFTCFTSAFFFVSFSQMADVVR